MKTPYEVNVTFKNIDWDRDEAVDRFMSGERVGSGSDGRTRDLVYGYDSEGDAERDRTRLMESEFATQLELVAPVYDLRTI